jgi:hypothetical protein
MLVQAKTIVSGLHQVPDILNNKSFCFSSVFRLGGPNDTNLSRRGPLFGDKFIDVADGKCCMPEQFKHLDIGANDGQIRALISSDSEQIWASRLPLKLVGYLKDQQKNGSNGLLLVNGQSNYFLSRSVSGMLELVELVYSNNAWQIDSVTHQNNDLKANSRLFVAVR